jgi:hypothetical protein
MQAQLLVRCSDAADLLGSLLQQQVPCMPQSADHKHVEVAGACLLCAPKAPTQLTIPWTDFADMFKHQGCIAQQCNMRTLGYVWHQLMQQQLGPAPRLAWSPIQHFGIWSTTLSSPHRLEE